VSATALPAAEEVIGYFETLSNWGRWGDDDRLGTLNNITPEVRLKAAGLVRTGEILSLSYDLDSENPDPLCSGIATVQRFMGLGEVEHGLGTGVRFDAVTDYVGIAAHGGNTHLDGLAHYSWDGKNYNGFDVSESTSLGGARKLSVHHASDGIVSRGVLLDICSLHGVEWLEAGYAISPEELLAAQERQGVTVEPGDVLLIHSGDAARTLAHGAVRESPRHVIQQAGISAASLPFLREWDISALGNDGIQDVQPSGYDTIDLFRPVHAVSLVALGLWLIDNMCLTGLAARCAELQRWSFFFAMVPWRMKGVTSCATNAVALF
jgi:kynurenine formamidase